MKTRRRKSLAWKEHSQAPEPVVSERTPAPGRKKQQDGPNSLASQQADCAGEAVVGTYDKVNREVSNQKAAGSGSRMVASMGRLQMSPSFRGEGHLQQSSLTTPECNSGQAGQRGLDWMRRSLEGEEPSGASDPREIQTDNVSALFTVTIGKITAIWCRRSGKTELAGWDSRPPGQASTMAE